MSAGIIARRGTLPAMWLGNNHRWGSSAGIQAIPLLQLGVFRLGLLEDGKIGVSVLPHGKEILIGGAGSGGVMLGGQGAGQTELRQRVINGERREGAAVEKLAELRGCVGSIAAGQVRLTAQHMGIEKL